MRPVWRVISPPEWPRVRWNSIILMRQLASATYFRCERPEDEWSAPAAGTDDGGDGVKLHRRVKILRKRFHREGCAARDSARTRHTPGSPPFLGQPEGTDEGVDIRRSEASSGPRTASSTLLLQPSWLLVRKLFNRFPSNLFLFSASKPMHSILYGPVGR